MKTLIKCRQKLILYLKETFFFLLWNHYLSVEEVVVWVETKNDPSDKEYPVVQVFIGLFKKIRGVWTLVWNSKVMFINKI